MATASATRKKNRRKGEKSRACWNAALEKSLVLILHEHNNTSFRDGNNKWSTKAWDKIVKEFNDRNRYVSFTKMQIQDKEGEMKRDYKMLKEARRQTGFTWNEDRCMIEAEPSLWDKLIITFPKAKKFHNNKASFPLFDELGELHEGHPAEGIQNCTSNEPSEDSPCRQVDNTDEIDLEEVRAYDVEDDDIQVQITEDGDASSERNEQMLQRRVDSLSRDEEDEAASAERNGLISRAPTESSTSPKLSHRKGEKSRACWNAALEKSLVVILHEHNNTGFRDVNNKWSTRAWEKIVKEFNDRNRNASFTKMQIQDKEGELKRDYKMLKEARRQTGFTWNEDRCMIEAESALWEKLIITFPKAKKFNNNKASFPLFDELRELHEGHPAERIYNCTSNELSQDSPHTQDDKTDEIDSEEVMAYDVEDDDAQVQITEDEDASSERNEQMIQRRIDSLSRDKEDEVASAERNGQKRRAATESRKKEENEAKRMNKSGNIEGSMKRHLDVRRKEVENEATQVAKIKDAAQGTDFSIKKCVSILNSMEVTKEEKAKAYALFKNQDDREIFLSACSEDPESAMIWLRNEMA